MIEDAETAAAIFKAIARARQALDELEGLCSLAPCPDPETESDLRIELEVRRRFHCNRPPSPKVAAILAKMPPLKKRQK